MATVLWLFASPIHADDWLELFPECAFGPEARALGQMAVLYPKPGRAAVVRQGDKLWTRIRVPTGLTPPPGRQQDRALRGWSAELVGHAAQGWGRAEHRYPLRVVDVRPDGPSSLVYRAALIVPAWAAPGTYGLRISAPGGSAEVAGSIRIVDVDAPIRLAMLSLSFDAVLDAAQAIESVPQEGPSAPTDEGSDTGEDAERARLLRLLEALSYLPIDVWVAMETPRLRSAASLRGPEDRFPAMLWLREQGHPIAVRVGDELLTLGECDDAVLRFSERLDGLMTERGGRHRRLDRAALPTEPGRYRHGDDLSSVPNPTFLSIDRDEDSVRLSLAANAESSATVLLRVPNREGLQGAPSESVRFWPGTPVGPRTVPSVVAELQLAPGADLTLRPAAGQAPTFRIEASPQPAHTAQRVRLWVDPPASFVAWELAEDATALGPEAAHTWGALGTHQVRALVISDDGVASHVTTEIPIETQRVSGCTEGSCQLGSGLGYEFWFVGLLLIKRARGNRRGRPRRSPAGGLQKGSGFECRQ